MNMTTIIVLLNYEFFSEELKTCITHDLMTLCFRETNSRFAFTRQSSALLEKIAVCVNHEEPVLLVGETGTGKTSVVQYIAQQTGMF